MVCPWRTSDLWLLLILTVFLVASSTSCMHGKQTTQNISALPIEVNTSLTVLMGTKAVLCCHPIPLTNVVLITWEIIPRDRPICKISYKGGTNEITKNNCTDERITWASRPDVNPGLQIHPVALSHDGYYRCQMAASNGNFDHGYRLQVSVCPEVTLSPVKNRTAVCKAVAGKPAAQVSWAPVGDCVTEQEHWDNGTVTVWSTCRWPDSNVSAVTCSVSHLCGNKSLSQNLLPDPKGTSHEYILYIIFPILLVVIGTIWFLICIYRRKCKLQKPEATPAVEEDEMQPYASYTEKSNPLYDTANKAKMSQMLQSEVDGMGLNSL
ncbi:cell surface glycoprotein CD200 receptor 1 precursor [Oryctolagus cuniculus]|uniref:Membrane glycoprotein CD200R n=1 Tax=Oryctolagus cuniculus TaxID=9986 RepID=A0A0S4XR64_RABIT|nr:cell surface glycoprotein CD200 receptor 1 precursor [Oryctolagus cuniculus]DAA64969.1 TPA_exp: membrane glycoprotein CD200R [Oryctolagus cuniculus]